MTLEELKHLRHEAEKLRRHVDMLIQEQTQQPEQPRLERWKPQFGSYYYYLDAKGNYSHTKQSEHFAALHEFFNVFPTSAEAEKEALRTRARRKLEWMAKELNSNRSPYPITRFVISFDGDVTVQQYNPLYLTTVYFYDKADAEYALSQMNAEELEALRTFPDAVEPSFTQEMPDEEMED